jgi:rhamnose utilization protein RhaD (predicted bifunctional aldolase and dehydrogenase)
VTSELQQLVAVSRRYGADPAFVLAGGGNTSIKNGNRLWVKASGQQLSTITDDGFCELDRDRLQAMLRTTWSADPKDREAAFTQGLMAARVHPELGQRPSVEALLHHLLATRFVVHTHPGRVNALTCCTEGQALAHELFGDSAIWQPYVDPGVVLAQTLEQTVAAHPTGANVILLGNHGLIVTEETTEGIARESTRVMDTVRQCIAKSPPLKSPPTRRAELLDLYAAALEARRPALITITDDSEPLRQLISNPRCLSAALAGPLTPDQIVYCRSVPLYFEAPATDLPGAQAQWETKWAAYEREHGYEPWVALIAGAGLIAFRQTQKLAHVTRAIYADSTTVYNNAMRLGGVRTLDLRQRRFIEEWEVEAFRRAVMSKPNS